MRHSINYLGAEAMPVTTEETSNTSEARTKHSFMPKDEIPRYDQATYDKKKRSGASYTPCGLAEFVAKQIVENIKLEKAARVRVLDPAVGDGELLLAICRALEDAGHNNIEIHGYDTDDEALGFAESRIRAVDEHINVRFEHQDFLSYVLENFCGDSGQTELFNAELADHFDVVIANPPYVRTQLLGADKAKKLAEQFSLSGRVDLYHAFILAIGSVLHEGGMLGIIVSNRFMTTKSGASVRECFALSYELLHVWDMGDTKLFDEAVLPAVIVGRRTKGAISNKNVPFTRTYKTECGKQGSTFDTVLTPLEQGYHGTVQIDGICFEITQGCLDQGKARSEVWRISTPTSEKWLRTVAEHQYCDFRSIGKIRVGVKTTADKVFIRKKWNDLPEEVQPEQEVLLPLITHKQARRWKGLSAKEQPRILYTHTLIGGKRRPIEITKYPKAANYLEAHRETLEKRKYVIDAGRQWYEIWVPHDPSAWKRPKLVFRDIAEHSTFFLDLDGSVINGDCYWMVANEKTNEDMLWLALAVANSTFILKYYDEKFHNKLYANRRRFMTQYVEQFPIPDPSSACGRDLVEKAKKAYKLVESGNEESLSTLENEIDEMVWEAFGLVKE